MVIAGVRFPAALLLWLAACLGCARPGMGPPELSVAREYDITSLDPHADNTNARLELLSNVYEPLMDLDAEMKIRPCLAVSWDSPDPLTWVFHLRPSVHFHDGTPLTAQDVVFTMNRLLQDERLKVRSHLSGVAEAVARGPDQVALRAKWPNAVLASALRSVLIVPRGATAASLETRPNGTGPYAVESWTPRRTLRLRRHDEYWGPRPELPSATLHLGVTHQEILTGVASGRFQILFDHPDVAEAAQRTGRYRVLSHQNFYLRHLAFDLARDATPSCPGIRNPFKDRRVREAIHLALDRNRLAAGIAPDAVPAAQIVPRAIVGHDPYLRVPSQDLPLARQLLARAGLGGGFDVVLHSTPSLAPAARLVKEQLAAVAIRVSVAVLPSADFFAALNRRELSFWLVANGALTGDAIELLQDSFQSPDAARGFGADNYADYRNPELDREILETVAVVDPAVRGARLRGMLRRLLQDLVWVPLYHEQATFVVEKSYSYRPRGDLLFRLADVGRSPLARRLRPSG